MTKDNNNQGNGRPREEDSILMPPPPPKRARGGDAPAPIPSSELSNSEVASAAVVTASTSSNDSVSNVENQQPNTAPTRDELSELIGTEEEIIKDYLKRTDRNEVIQEAADLAQQFSPPEDIELDDPVWQINKNASDIGITPTSSSTAPSQQAPVAPTFDYNAIDPREVLKAASKLANIEKSGDLEGDYKHFQSMHMNAQRGEILGPATAALAQQEGRLAKFEVAALKTAYELNGADRLSREEAGEVVDADINLARKYNTQTPVTKFLERVQTSTQGQGQGGPQI